LISERQGLGIDIAIFSSCDSGSGSFTWARILDRRLVEQWLRELGCDVDKICLTDIAGIPSATRVETETITVWAKP